MPTCKIDAFIASCKTVKFAGHLPSLTNEDVLHKSVNPRHWG